MERRRRIFEIGAALLSLTLAAACTTTLGADPTPVRPPPAPLDDSLQHTPLDPASVKISPEPITVEGAFILHLYTWFHRRDYETFRLEFPGELGTETIGHLLIPPGPGPHPTVVVFPILAGSHTVSEALAKALVNRGYLVARIERPDLELDTTNDPETPARALRGALLDARRMVDFLETRPEVDSSRLASAGVSLGGILACLLHAVDPRIQAGFYIMAGADLPHILFDSTERPVRAFRNHIMEHEHLDDAEGFVTRMTPIVGPLDPLQQALRIDPKTAWLASTRFDRVIRPVHADQLWNALGQPTRVWLPSGHYQLLPFFWWTIARGADHLDRVLGVTGEH